MFFRMTMWKRKEEQGPNKTKSYEEESNERMEKHFRKWKRKDNPKDPVKNEEKEDKTRKFFSLTSVKKNSSQSQAIKLCTTI